ncbi:alpha/beta fold hydrolase [Candidatus Uabimicrobium sp. HlEnr_7]|uniref:alpha/beta fold hydrolase n=1 Tax=Candidatus Uabimicrobium helgolandensis TaxID=3095367 RepID=UPI003555EFC8
MKSTSVSISRSDNHKKNLVIIPGISTLLYPTIWKLLSPSYFSYYAKYFTVNIVTFNNLPQNCDMQFIVDQYNKRLEQLAPYAVIAIEEGAFIAQHVAIQNPQLFKKLVLVSTTAKLCKKTKEIFDHWILCAQQDRWQSLHKSMSMLFSNKKSPIKYTFFKTPPNPQKLILLLQVFKDHDSRSLLKNINSETLVIGGDQNSLISQIEYLELMKLIPRAEILNVDDGCHHVYHQKKHTLENNILHFILR